MVQEFSQARGSEGTDNSARTHAQQPGCTDVRAAYLGVLRQRSAAIRAASPAPTPAQGLAQGLCREQPMGLEAKPLEGGMGRNSTVKVQGVHAQRQRQRPGPLQLSTGCSPQLVMCTPGSPAAAVRAPPLRRVCRLPPGGGEPQIPSASTMPFWAEARCRTLEGRYPVSSQIRQLLKG